MRQTQFMLPKIIAALWIIWGVVHMLAGTMVITSGTEGAFAAIADAINPDAFARDYHPAIGGIINQHGWNLLWFGVVTAISAVFIWRGNITAIWVAGMVGGLADLGYLIFVDLPGFVNVLPGTAMTVIAGGAIALSLVMMRMSRRSMAA